jgi:pimeloyl-ACP methyl ester carboxylesterase
LIGFSTGGGGVARYIGRHGTARVDKVARVSAVPPSCCRPRTTQGVPIEVFDGIRAGSLANRSQQYQDLADGPFFVPTQAWRERLEGTPRRVLAARPAVGSRTHKEQLGNNLLAFLDSSTRKDDA